MRKIKKAKLKEATAIRKNQTKAILELIKSELNQGQFKKLMKNEDVKAFFELYGIVDDNK